MYTLTKTKTGFTVTFSATYEGVDAVCQDVEQALSEIGLADLCFDIILGVREILNNGVRHGSKLDSEKAITFSFDTNEEGILIRVVDSGSGFDWREMEKKVTLPADISGRGMSILKQYFDSYRFNEIGNEVELVKKFKRS